MNKTTVDVIVPVKDRITVLECVSMLRSQITLAADLTLGSLLICDGGSQTVACVDQLRKANQLSSVQVLDLSHAGFNKGWLLNQGIQAATAPILMTSDVDILWRADTLSSMCAVASQSLDHFVHVKDVKESEQRTTAISRSRYTYRLRESPTGPNVEIYPDIASADCRADRRPGYGLLCAQRSLFEKVGGYRHSFQGWGWEDQDFLIRAQLLGYKTKAVGQVTHLSHGDACRNTFRPQQTPQQSRDCNISRCLSGVNEGRLLGDLVTSDVSVSDEPVSG